MAERIDQDGEEMDRLPPEEDDNDSDDEVDRLFELMHEGEEDEEEEEEEVEDEQPLDTESSESFELDTPAERSGHVAVIDRNTMYVWGGYKNAQNHRFFDLYLPRTEIWAYNIESGVWTKHIAGGNLHTSMSGSCGVCVDGVLYLFGGSYSLEAMATAPQGPHQGSFEFDESSSFGWDSPGRGWNNHVHILDLETSTWSQPITTGSRPLPRAAHACATVGNRGYVFGGRYKNYRLNDLYYIDLDTWVWHEMSVPQHGPVGRSWHSFTPVSADHIFLFGGFTTERETLSDAWLYYVSKNEWKPFKHSHTGRPRLWHTACSGPDGEVFVFGGCANNLLAQQRAAHSNELLIFNVQPKSLVRFCMEAVLQHRERLSQYWDCLPKHLFHSLKLRMTHVNTLGS
ncbi:hypothetical protein fugu_016398 [Takifugu bimaculatus]|uniref:Kelch domain-containing protein 2 n=1 Tax=Takifugu bimaculatus TaxID=433685 RepID=A0A4Z2BSV8_9TELE|nr:hypothetical protein fugu_016398 [Takifugu bimaculatus]